MKQTDTAQGSVAVEGPTEAEDGLGSNGMTTVFGAHGRVTPADIVDVSLGGLRGVQELEDLVASIAFETLPSALQSYPGTQGTVQLLEAFCGLWQTEGLMGLCPSDLVATHGALDGLAHALIAFEADTAIFATPGFGVDIAAARAQCDPVPVPWHVDDPVSVLLATLEDAIARSLGRVAVVVNFPSNPAGSVPSAAEWDSLIEMTAQAGALLVVDEVYRFCAEGQARCPTDFDHVVFVDSVSKRFGLPGLRLGFAATTSDSLKQALRESVGRTSVGVSAAVTSFGTQLAERYVANETVAKAVLQQLGYRRDVLAECVAGVQGHALVSGSGLYGCVPLPSLEAQTCVIEELFKEHQVAVTAGTALAVGGTPHPPFIRVCIGSTTDPHKVGSALADVLTRMPGQR